MGKTDKSKPTVWSAQGEKLATDIDDESSKAVKKRKKPSRRSSLKISGEMRALIIKAVAVFVAVLAVGTGWSSFLDKPTVHVYRKTSSITTVASAEITQKNTVEGTGQAQGSTKKNSTSRSFDFSQVPSYSGEASTEINGGQPYFSAEDRTSTDAWEHYADLDNLNRCGVAYINACKDTMPTEERGKIGGVKPSGWHSVTYTCIADRYLYNRCHLAAFCLSGENANEKNLITGTRYLNIEGMLPFETDVADYIDKTGNHVLYRVTPIFIGDELVARGVLMEGYSVEDKGLGICFNKFCYNVQPGVVIDYATGDSKYDK